MKSILLVCLGNICRSPMAQGAVRLALDEAGLAHIETDSAGTSGWHVGSPPDPRAVKTALMRDMDISGQRARQVETTDFDRFDIIAAMDRNNYARLRELQPDGSTAGSICSWNLPENFRSGKYRTPITAVKTDLTTHLT